MAAALAILKAVQLGVTGITGLQAIVEGFKAQAAILHLQGEISDDELNQIIEAGAIPAAQRNAEVEAAKARLAGE